MKSFSRLKTVNFTWITYQWVWIMQINLETWQDFFAEAIVRLCSISVFQHHFFKGKFKTMFSFVIFLFSPSVVIWDFFLCYCNWTCKLNSLHFIFDGQVMWCTRASSLSLNLQNKNFCAMNSRSLERNVPFKNPYKKGFKALLRNVSSIVGPFTDFEKLLWLIEL